MAKNTSDRNGRSLEFAIVDVLLTRSPNLIPLSNTLSDQKRDSIKFDELAGHQKSYFSQSANQIYEWLQNKIPLNREKTSLERLNDNEAKKGDVTDIRIKGNGFDINLSIKHNHLALKHQRPSATLQQCGYLKNTPEDIEYRRKYKDISDTFLAEANSLLSTATTFAELINVDAGFVKNQLYIPMCNLVCDFLNTYASRYPDKAQYFFNFIVGLHNYYKIVVYQDKIEILEFANIPKVNTFTATVRDGSYIDVKFSNGWNILMRLHTASSKLKGVSLKFDSQLLESSVPKFTIVNQTVV